RFGAYPPGPAPPRRSTPERHRSRWTVPEHPAVQPDPVAAPLPALVHGRAPAEPAAGPHHEQHAGPCRNYCELRPSLAAAPAPGRYSCNVSVARSGRNAVTAYGGTAHITCPFMETRGFPSTYNCPQP